MFGIDLAISRRSPPSSATMIRRRANIDARNSDLICSSVPHPDEMEELNISYFFQSNSPSLTEKQVKLDVCLYTANPG